MKETTILPSLPYTALRDAALKAMRKAILEGKLRPGERLLESEIARQLGTSRAPVREATRQLESEGLVVSIPHRGTYVTVLSPQDAREIYSMRAAVEGLAVMLVTKEADPHVLDSLGEQIQRMQQLADAGDATALIQADFKFHELLCRAAHHTRLLDTWLSMNVQIRAFVSMTHLEYLAPCDVVRQHRAVLEAMRRQDGEGALWLLANDILRAGEHVATGLASSQ